MDNPSTPTDAAVILGGRIKAAMSASLMSDKVEAEQSRNVDKLIALATEPAAAEVEALRKELDIAMNFMEPGRRATVRAALDSSRADGEKL